MMSIHGEGVTSKSLNQKLDVPRSTVIYHLNQFIYSGLVVRKGRRYYLRSDDMTSTLQEMQADMMREFSRMMELAAKFDEIVEEDTHGRKRDSKR
jgi:predicted transcriptional regulator